LLERLEAAPKQSSGFPEMRQPQDEALLTVKTGGIAQQWVVNNIKIATGTFVTIQLKNREITVDEN